MLDAVKPGRRYSVLDRAQRRSDGTRHVVVETFIATDDALGTRRIGWVWHDEYLYDANLTTRRGELFDGEMSADWSAFGGISVPVDAQWLGIDAGSEPQIVAAIRRYEAKQPSIPISLDVTPRRADGAGRRRASRYRSVARIAATSAFRSRCTTPCSARARPAPSKSDRGSSSHGRATLTAATPFVPTPGHTSARFSGTLAIHLVDGDGRTID